MPCYENILKSGSRWFTTGHVIMSPQHRTDGGGKWQAFSSMQHRVINKHSRFLRATIFVKDLGPPLLSSGQGSCLQTQRFRVRFPALPAFMRSSGSGTGSTQLCEDSWGATWLRSSDSGLEKSRMAVGTRCAHHATLQYPQKLTLALLTSGGRTGGIVCLLTKSRGVCFCFWRILFSGGDRGQFPSKQLLAFVFSTSLLPVAILS
jgi:hypothetical protein